MALATAPFGAPGLRSDWGIIGLAQSTNMLETRVWPHPTPVPREESLQTKMQTNHAAQDGIGDPPRFHLCACIKSSAGAAQEYGRK